MEEQFDRALYELLSDEQVLTESESVTKSDVEQIAKRMAKLYFNEIRNSELETKVKSTVREMLKNDKEVEKYVVDIAKNVLVQLYKALWSKRSFWTSDLRNISS